ncbi:MAG: flagellar basal body-associated FliL family protein [Synergistaceae bacterium]|jgi:flagellar basal body-associated protein FliL|nr:flagellar basal body-associated FliL family protein [Synergistaceae bacterium]
MAFARKTLIISIVGIVVLIAGVIGGAVVGLRYFGGSAPAVSDQVPDPGPMLELGQFTSTLADQEIHVVKLKITLELTGMKAYDRINASANGWMLTIKDEVIKTLKDQRYDVIRFTEGMESLKLDLKTRLNSILPREAGEASIKKILFDEYMTQ